MRESETKQCPLVLSLPAQHCMTFAVVAVGNFEDHVMAPVLVFAVTQPQRVEGRGSASTNAPGDLFSPFSPLTPCKFIPILKNIINIRCLSSPPLPRASVRPTVYLLLKRIACFLFAHTVQNSACLF